MSSGYVLDFSNRSFSEFFSEEVGVDIDEPRFSDLGTSKANRLRRFFQIADSATIARALRAIWQYRDAMLSGTGRQDPMPNARGRFDSILASLGPRNQDSQRERLRESANNLLDLIRAITKAEFDERRRAHSQHIKTLLADAKKATGSDLNRVAHALEHKCEAELRERAQFATDTVKRVLRSADIALLHTIAATAKEILRTVIESAYAELTTDLRKLTEDTPGLAGYRFSIEYSLSTTRNSQVELAQSQIDLLLLERENARAREPSNADGAPERVLQTILFTDIVGSTEHLRTVGDFAWRLKLEEHYQITDEKVREYGGHIVEKTGDGVVAVFDAPGRAIECGLSLSPALSRLALSIRTGLHTGELERDGTKIYGIAVHTAQRVMSEAGAGEVFTSEVTAAVVDGSNMRLEAAGVFELKGLNRTMKLFRARN